MLNKRPLVCSFIYYFLFSSAVCLVAKSCISTTSSSDKEEWQALFNGVDIKDWTPNFNNVEVGVNYKNTFTVQDSLLTVTYTEWDTFDNKFGHLFHDDEFSYYKIRSTYRFIGDQVSGGEDWAYRNNGLMLHCQTPESMTFDQAFPLSLEFQLLGGNGTDPRTNGNLCTPGCHVKIYGSLEEEHCINADSKTFHGDQWIHAEAVVYGDSLFYHILNGDTVMTYTDAIIGGWLPHRDTVAFVDGTPLTKGLISIQAESHPIQFKNIDVLDLCGCMDPKAKNYKSYFIKADHTKCVY